MSQVLLTAWAERARTLLAGARRGELRTAGGAVDVALDDAGLTLTLAHDDPAVAGLAQCRVATLVVPGAWSLRVVASFRMGHPDATGARTYAPTLLSVRMADATGRSVTVPVEEFLRAQPAADVVRRRHRVDHLASEHADALLDRARVVAGVEQLEVLGEDLEDLVVLTADGVVRMPVGALCACG